MGKLFKSITAGVCAVSMISSLSACASGTSVSVPVSAEATSMNKGSSSTELDESKINVTVNRIEPFSVSGETVNIYPTYNIVSGDISGPEYIDRLSLKITATNTSADELKERAYMGFNSIKSGYSGGITCGASECIEIDKNTYMLHFGASGSGDSYHFQIQGLDNIEGFDVISYTASNKLTYKVEAYCSEGDDICAFLPDSEKLHLPDSSGKLNEEAVTNWVKNQCLLANSFKPISNNKGYDTIYYYFNGSAGYADASTISWAKDNEISYISGCICYCEEAKEEEYDLIKLNEKAFNYFTMHEMSHVYNMNTDFDVTFNFADDFIANPRALAALRNSENIKNYKVRKNENSSGETKLFTYDQIYNLNYYYKAADDYIYYFARNVINACGWEKLGDFFKAESASEYDLDDAAYLAEKLKSRFGLTFDNFDSDIIEGKKKQYLKFVNMLRWLYSLSTEKEYNEGDFISFIDQYFGVEKIGMTGLECIPKLLIKEGICDSAAAEQPTAINKIGSIELYDGWSYCEGFDYIDSCGYYAVTVDSNGSSYDAYLKADNIVIVRPADGVNIDVLDTAVKKVDEKYTVYNHQPQENYSDFTYEITAIGGMTALDAKKVISHIKESGLIEDALYLDEHYQKSSLFIKLGRYTFDKFIADDGTETTCAEHVAEYLKDNEIPGIEKINLYDNSNPPSKNRLVLDFSDGITRDEKFDIVDKIFEATGVPPYISYSSGISNFVFSEANSFNFIDGDANTDGMLALSDSVIILQSIGNPDKYSLSVQGRFNADIAGYGDGITNLDALTIQRMLLKLEY